MLHKEFLRRYLNHADWKLRSGFQSIKDLFKITAQTLSCLCKSFANTGDRIKVICDQGIISSMENDGFSSSIDRQQEWFARLFQLLYRA